MQHDITKLCADSLRSFTENRLDFKLKSSHAHELVAAFFGYQSRAALLADTQFPISNLEQADYIILPPYNDNAASVFKQRKNDMSITLLDEADLCDIFYEVFKRYGLSQRLEDVACVIASRRLDERFKVLGIDSDGLNLVTEVVDSKASTAEISFVVSVDYVSDTGTKTQHDSTMVVTFPRVAGHVGYKKPSVQETRYSGEFRHLSRKAIPQWPYPRGTLVMVRNTKEVGIVLKAEDRGYGGSVTMCKDDSLNALYAKEEVFPLADQSVEFIPMRLYLPYGKWTCADGTEVLFNRDYCPLWAKKNNDVIPLDPDTWVRYQHESTHYFNDGSAPWNSKDSLSTAKAALKEWGVENMRPRTLDLLAQAIKSGDVDTLSPKNTKKVFP